MSPNLMQRNLCALVAMLDSNIWELPLVRLSPIGAVKLFA